MTIIDEMRVEMGLWKGRIVVQLQIGGEWGYIMDYWTANSPAYQIQAIEWSDTFTVMNLMDEYRQMSRP